MWLQKEGGDLRVRLEKVELRCFKNICHGEVSFLGRRSLISETPDILGVYGQNGSGKTALINSLSVLKFLLTGRRLPEDVVYFVMAGQTESQLRFDFCLLDGERNDYSVSYEVTLRITEHVEESADATLVPEKGIVVANERLSFGGLVLGQKKNKQVLADAAHPSLPVTPKVKLDRLTGNSNEAVNDLRVAKKFAYRDRHSFLFSASTIKLFRENSTDASLVYIIESLRDYGYRYLFVLDTRDTGLISLNAALPFSFAMRNKERSVVGTIPVPLNKAAVIPLEPYKVVEGIISKMNVVLKQLIPDLQVGTAILGEQLLDDGSKGVSIQLLSVRGNTKLPLSTESEGIKKLISILQLLIAAYNVPSITFAVDELDAGIFEYLLGEVLRIFSESGKGQLIFTSHNLRPLETLDDKCICFTTTNPDNRFIKLSGIQSGHNVRSQYYRTIMLGGQHEKLYDKANNYEIALALRLAGDSFGG